MAENIKVIKECNDISYDEAMDRLHDRVEAGLIPAEVADSYENKISELYAKTKLTSPKCAAKGMNNILGNWWRLDGNKNMNYEPRTAFVKTMSDYVDYFSYTGNFEGHRRLFTITDAFGPGVDIMDRMVGVLREMNTGSIQYNFDRFNKKIVPYCENSNIQIDDLVRESEM
ncbi:MAG: hypothetical protein E7361_03755 [Clostridiales bacterium]|nr:hypothetical protein [Clostridiales bacterium]